jgi:acyl carrier protein phosphodiesterase
VNYLGHLIVLPDAGLITLGNLLGDFVKGRLEFVENPQFRSGVALHRAIDRFADQHETVRRAMTLITPPRKRIAGVLVDIFFDHFYALKTGDLTPYRELLEPFVSELPAELQPLPGRMITSRWLGSYRTVDGIAEVLQRMEAHRTQSMGLAGAEQELLNNYDALQREAEAFLPHAQAFARDFTKDLHRQSASPAAAPLGEAEESV